MCWRKIKIGRKDREGQEGREISPLQDFMPVFAQDPSRVHNHVSGRGVRNLPSDYQWVQK